MRWERHAWLIVVAAGLGACVSGTGNPIQRAAVHQGIGFAGVDGPLAQEVADFAGSEAFMGGALYAGDLPPSGGLNWTRLVSGPSGSLWRRRDPVRMVDVAVQDDPVPGMPIDDSTFVGWTATGRGDPGGEVVVELFVRPPMVTPVRPCVALTSGGVELDLGVFLDGRLPLVPGASMRPLYRHRARVDVPADWPGAVDRLEGDLTLLHCRTRTAVTAPVRVSAPLSGRLSTRAELERRTGVPDPDAKQAALKPPRQSLHRQPDGSIEVREGPPLPRMLRGDAWGVLMLPAVDPRGWTVGGSPSGHPLAPLLPQLSEADAAIIGWDAPASRVGVPPDGLVDPRRVPPEALAALPGLGVDALVLGPHRADAGPEGLAATLDAAARLGLRVDDGGTTLVAGDGDRGVGVRIATVRSAPELPGAVIAANTAAPGALVLVQVEEDDGSAQVGDMLRNLVANGGVDAVWTLGGGPPTIEIIDGVPILRGWSPLGATGWEGLAVRWYVAPEGVRRLDLIGLVRSGAQWERDRDGTLRRDLLALAERSLAVDTHVVVGRTVAAVDVAAHGPYTRSPLATTVALEALEPRPLPKPTRPPRCDPPPGVGTGETPLGRGLVLESATIVDADVPAGDPIRVRLVWRRTAGPALEAGALSWSATGLTSPWRPRSEPCAGSWGFEHWQPGERVLDEVVLLPPEGVTGTAELQLQVRLGDALARPPSGERWIRVGEVRISEGEG